MDWRKVGSRARERLLEPLEFALDLSFIAIPAAVIGLAVGGVFVQLALEDWFAVRIMPEYDGDKFEIGEWLWLFMHGLATAVLGWLAYSFGSAIIEEWVDWRDDVSSLRRERRRRSDA
ncbi:MAG: hypothetical protein WD844_08030 [Thermoleophilaceae bacterium]